MTPSDGGGCSHESNTRLKRYSERVAPGDRLRGKRKGKKGKMLSTEKRKTARRYWSTEREKCQRKKKTPQRRTFKGLQL